MNPNLGNPPAGLGVVAHLHHVFFERSETFIHHAITALNRFRPILLAWEYRNLESFPFPDQDRYSLSSPRHSLAWWGEAAARRLAGRELRAEKILRQRRARLIHAHFGPSGVLALCLARRTSLPLVTTFYGNDVSILARDPRCLERYRKLFAGGQLFLTEGPYMRDRLAGLGCPVEKIQIQRIAIPVAKLPFRLRQPKGKQNKVVIAFSGRFIEKKGLLIALAALRRIRHARACFEFRIIGDGPLRPEIERFINAHDMGAYVRLLGFLNYHDYLRQMDEADLFLHPSVTSMDGDSEGGAPTTILEAQAMGLPVLASRHADIPYVVVPGQSALLSDERDEVGLAADIARLLEDQEAWSTMGATGHRHIGEFHDISREIPRMEDRYAELINSRLSGNPG